MHLRAVHKLGPRTRALWSRLFPRQGVRMNTQVFGVLGLDIDREWTFGAVTFKPAGLLADDVRLSKSQGARGSALQAMNDRVDEVVDGWSSHATAHVHATKTEEAIPRVKEALAALRFLIRGFIDVNRDLHKVGLIDEVALTIRDVVVLFEGGGTGAGWHRVAGPVEVTITEEKLLEWGADSTVVFLDRELAKPPDARTSSGGRAITALQVLDSGFLAMSSTIKALFYVIADETVFGIEDEELRRRQSAFAIARRFAYLTCANQCARRVPPCPFIRSIPTYKQLMNVAEEGSAKNQQWLCQAFMLVACPDELIQVLPITPLFTVRNEIAHTGVTRLNEKQVGTVRGLADTAVNAALVRFAENPSATIADLDAEIDERVASSSS